MFKNWISGDRYFFEFCRIRDKLDKFQELKEIVKLDSAKIDNALAKKKQRLKSLKEIEKNIEP